MIDPTLKKAKTIRPSSDFCSRFKIVSGMLKEPTTLVFQTPSYCSRDDGLDSDRRPALLICEKRVNKVSNSF